MHLALSSALCVKVKLLLFSISPAVVLLLCKQRNGSVSSPKWHLAAGRTPPKQTVLWFRAPGGKATQVHVCGNKLDVERMKVSAGLTHAALLLVMSVRLYSYSPAADIEGWVPCATCCQASCLRSPNI